MPIIEGDLNIAPESSDDEDDNNDDLDGSTHIDVNIDSGSDDAEEVLEVFTNARHPKKDRSTNHHISDKFKTNSLSLVAAMSQAVSAVEANDNTDVFGISYKPFKKKDPGYQMPSGPAFEDELEFQLDLSSSATLPVKSAIIEDDEFDFTDRVESDNDQQLVANACMRAASELERLASASKTEAAVALLEAQAPPVVQPKLILKSTVGVGVVSEAIEEGDEEEEEQAEVREVEAALQQEVLMNTVELEWEQVTKVQTTVNSKRSVALNQVAVNSNDSQPVFGHSSSPRTSFQSPSTCPPLRYDETVCYLKAVDLKAYESQIVVSEGENNGAGWVKSLMGSGIVPLNFVDCREELKFPFLVAQLDYDAEVWQHFSIMQSVFALLTGRVREQVVCPKTGPHWDEIGFQGINPCTDVNRSMKMLAILQVRHLVEEQLGFARRLIALATLPQSASHQQDMTWPFMCVSISFTKEAVQATRRGDLNKRFNKAQAVLPVMNDFHHACFYEFSKRILQSPGTHHAVHLQAVRERCATNSRGLLKDYNKALDRRDAGELACDLSEAAKKATTRRKAAANTSAADGSEAQIEERFDDLEGMHQQLEAELAENSGNKNSGSGFWNTIGLGDKASKFKA